MGNPAADRALARKAAIARLWPKSKTGRGSLPVRSSYSIFAADTKRSEGSPAHITVTIIAVL